ncbi:N-acetyl-alpha-D-glucosaminyl L-malate synthase BshA [Alkalicoccus urumqiensis]|uniref:N-acetyl-alpha-D-glucosaminyl L-malate synthase BshA n=1 Tax=Alkalicoccus urumqiensis TaxID=1548213 RepID=A0A2P6MKM8_ALKUR|nr:N-acetyl-alpha-D-glucosaminyl L-malate synthase BshA [Alkalicoccus urumqiensis]PRO66836.1 N-acetyl-alpha-D-glucosaminyl L-malate synthase BshA [Alkalicoccus urumqiensis]
MKIGITCYPTVGGSGVVATELGRALAQRGHEVHFITSSIPYRLDVNAENIFFHEVTVNSYSVFQYPPYDLTLASKMADVIKQENLDILHVHYAIPHAVSAYLAKEMTGGRVRIVTTLHGTDITVLGHDPSFTDMIRFGIERSDLVTAVSTDLIRQTQSLLGTDKAIRTVYNFIDEADYYPKPDTGLRESFGIKPGEKVLSHVSNFRKVKRVEDVVRVFQRVQKEMPAHLLLIGDGPELPVIREMVQKQNIQHVHITGTQRQVADLLSISDMKLLLSSKESFGLVLLEAMACGVPVCGTDVGGIPEVIEDGRSGLIFPLGALDETAAGIVSVLKDPKRHEAMRIEAKRRVKEDFHKEDIVSQYERLYKEVLTTV